MEHPKSLLNYHGIFPKKSLGQNFLFEASILDQIIAAADLQPDEPVLEIGPGLGHLTDRLAQTAVSVTAVELDQRFLPILNAQLAPYDHVTVIHGDILDQQMDALFDRPYKVIANVPYYITGAIIQHLLSSTHKPSRMVLTVQKEVAERITAVPPNSSVLSVTTQLYGEVSLVNSIKAGAFWPRPNVDSAVITIDLHSPPLFSEAEEKKLMRLVRIGFSQKRKQLKNNLKQLGFNTDQIAALCQAAGIDGKRRAETLSLAEWLALHRVIATQQSSARS